MYSYFFNYICFLNPLISIHPFVCTYILIMVLCACMLWLFCRWVSSKDIDPLMIEPMTVLAAEVVNKLQMGFPPSFFDNQVHLLVHLPREVQLCGPVHSCWMYFWNDIWAT